MPPEKLLELQRTRQEAQARRHLGSFGRQITAARRTNPAFSFGKQPSPHQPPERPSARSRELTEHPMNPNPASSYVSSDACRTLVLKGWGRDRRFPEDPSQAEMLLSPIRHSTHASPFSPTYPYEEPRRDPSATGEKPGLGKSASPRGGRREQPQAEPDHNALHCTFSRTPQWSFGSSGLGYRYQQGTHFSRQAHIGVTTRQKTFRELRMAF